MGGKGVNARAYLSEFNFAGADQEKLCGVLSGGERNRLHLALTLKADANVLLLDEPTNDIDVNTLRALEEGLENFARLRRRRLSRPLVLGPYLYAYPVVRGRFQRGLLRRDLFRVRGIQT